MNAMDEKFKRLKAELFDWGLDYIEEFLGVEADGYSHAELDALMDEVCEQMPEEILNEFYEKFMIE